MTSPPLDPQVVDEDQLVRVVIHLPRSLVRRLDERKVPGRSRAAICRDLLTDAVQVAS